MSLQGCRPHLQLEVLERVGGARSESFGSYSSIYTQIDQSIVRMELNTNKTKRRQTASSVATAGRHMRHQAGPSCTSFTRVQGRTFRAPAGAPGAARGDQLVGVRSLRGVVRIGLSGKSLATTSKPESRRENLCPRRPVDESMDTRGVGWDAKEVNKVPDSHSHH